MLDSPEPGFDSFVNGKALARAATRLEWVTKRLGLRSLDDFASIDPVEARAMVEDLGGDPAGLEFPEEVWFEPDEGLAWVKQVSEHLRANAATVKETPAVLADLQEYEEVLTKAKAIGARWHLQVDF